jgi:hypothetical protein
LEPTFTHWSFSSAIAGETILLRGYGLDLLASGAYTDLSLEANGIACIILNTTSTSIAVQLSSGLPPNQHVLAQIREAGLLIFDVNLSIYIASPQNVSSASVTAPYAGETIVLYGNGWSTTSRVTFDGTDLDQFEHSSGHVRFTVPANARLGVPVDAVIHPRWGSETVTYSLSVVVRIGLSPNVSYFGSEISLSIASSLLPDQIAPSLPDQLTCPGVVYNRITPGSGPYIVSALDEKEGLSRSYRCEIAGIPLAGAFEHQLVARPKIARSKL